MSRVETRIGSGYTNNRMGMDSGAQACVHIVPRHVKWKRLLNPSKVGETLLLVAGTNVRVSDPGLLHVHYFLS